MKKQRQNLCEIRKGSVPGYGLVSKKYSEILVWSSLGRMLKADTSLYCKQGVSFTESKWRALSTPSCEV